MVASLIGIEIIILFIFALNDKDGFNSFVWIFIFIVIDVIVAMVGSVSNKGGKEKTERVGITDKYLFDKGMTYRNGHEYERYVAYYLERKGYSNVRITQRSGDFGADIICYDRNKNKIAVQCKMYSKPVGYRAVEEVISGMHYYGCSKAMVITNSTYTKQAIDAARKMGVVLYERVR